MKKNKKSETRAREQIASIKPQIAELDLICNGTLLHRRKSCGKPNCRCATDPAARHGPYYEWNRHVEGKLHHTSLSAQEAGEIQRALKNGSSGSCVGRHVNCCNQDP